MRFTDEQLQRLGDFQSWKESEDGVVTLLDYASYTATPDQLFAFAAVFFRQVVEYDHHYFFVDAFDQSTYERLKERHPDGREIQRTVNGLPVSRLLQNAAIDDAAARDCAQLIAAAWNEVHGRKGLVAEVHGASFEDLIVTLVNGHE